MKKSRYGGVSLFLGLSLGATLAQAGSPQFPTELDYGKLSPDEQREFESAAFLLNLRALGVLEPNGVICAQPGKDKNGNSTYHFSVQDKAFETGSCQLSSSQSGLSAKLKNLAKATIEYQKAVHGTTEKLPISVTGFADGQSFSTLGAQAKAMCGELANAKTVNGSYNQPLAQSRARGIANELQSVLGQMQPEIAGYDSPGIVGTNLKNCPTRRQVVISFGSNPAVNASQTVGDFEPSSQVDSEVQLGMNAAVSVQILRAHAKVQQKLGKKNNQLDCPKKGYDICVWNHLQSVMDELGFDKNDVACRSTTLALADQILGRATKTPNGDEMFKLALSNDPSWAKKWISEYSAPPPGANSQQIKEWRKTRTQMGACGSSGALHLAMPTSDMFGRGCERVQLFGEDYSVLVMNGVQSSLTRMEKNKTAVAALEKKRMETTNEIESLRQKLTTIDKSKQSSLYVSTQNKINMLSTRLENTQNDLKTRMSEQAEDQAVVSQFAGVQSFEDFKAYRAAGNLALARRNLSHNCVSPDLGVLAAGFEASPKRADYFVSPEVLGQGSVRAGYTEKSFSSVFNENGSKGFGCSACGSGIISGQNGLFLKNGIVAASESTFGKDGMNLIRGTTTKGRVTAASFMAPTLYEIPNCANCSCVTSMKDALEKAFASGGRKIAGSADGLVKAGGGQELNTAALKNSCLFAPPVAHACPVGPNGQAEQSKQGPALERTLTYINQALGPSTATFTDDFRGVLATIESCGKPGPAVKTVDHYQKLVDEVVCDTKPNPIVLPENKGNEKAECALAEKLLATSKQSGMIK